MSFHDPDDFGDFDDFIGHDEIEADGFTFDDFLNWVLFLALLGLTVLLGHPVWVWVWSFLWAVVPAF